MNALQLFIICDSNLRILRHNVSVLDGCVSFERDFDIIADLAPRDSHIGFSSYSLSKARYSSSEVVSLTQIIDDDNPQLATNHIESSVLNSVSRTHCIWMNEGRMLSERKCCDF
ncbi:Hypothetical predicted protein [Octopus vulgaris]|uniref:Uncharacterized protein n=1 Tax=Octopus vulgaris TaxID=6645 RepID=A0AA36ANB5_OCTVU|nr:Hypothetical predicted protein [Octopus vulgaris]